MDLISGKTRGPLAAATRGKQTGIAVSHCSLGEGVNADNIRQCLALLRDRGYPTAHRAAQVGDDHLSADLVVALGRNHLRILHELGVEPGRLRMLRSFDPRSGAHAPDVEDPYYGDHADFVKAFEVIDAALPGLHAWVGERLAVGSAQ